MAPTDGAIFTKMNMCTPQTTDVNISKGQSSRAIGLGGVALQRSKSPPFYISIDKAESSFSSE